MSAGLGTQRDPDDTRQVRPAGRPGGRRAQAARNDVRIREAAEEVFAADPLAPVAEVAKRAGVGISALYHRYPAKEDLLRTICADALARYIALAERALADDGDAWEAFATFMHEAVGGASHALTLRLAGTFTPSDELYREAERGQRLNVELFERTRASGALRDGLVVDDLAVVFEQLAAIRLGDADRNRRLRARYLTLVLDGMRAPAPAPLPGTPPTWSELQARWEPA